MRVGSVASGSSAEVLIVGMTGAIDDVFSVVGGHSLRHTCFSGLRRHVLCIESYILGL